MKIKYFVKEALRGFKTAKLSAFTSIFTISLSLILLAIYFSISINSNKLIRSLKEKVDVEVFLDDAVSNEDISDTKEKIKTIGGIKSINFISKEEATKIFENQFGPEMLEVLEPNPLPPSFKIALYDEYKSIEKISKIKSVISGYPKVTDVVYPEKSMQLIEKNASGLMTINLLMFILITIISVFLVSNTIRLVIASRTKLVDLLKLLGARNSFIVIPFIIEGFLQGLFAAVFSIGILFAFYYYINFQVFQNELRIDYIGLEHFAYLISIGIFLGIFGSSISVRRFIKKQRSLVL